MVKFWDYQESRFGIELYNLAKDSSESNNLTTKMPEKAAELDQLLNNYLVEVNSKTRGDNTIEKPAKKKKKSQFHLADLSSKVLKDAFKNSYSLFTKNK
ncbi:MAG: hypothetical protein MK132_11800 [Lentisphaerales bacterium]|nr:hypothetical protein [Lentisphaerales bacterium]